MKKREWLIIAAVVAAAVLVCLALGCRAPAPDKGAGPELVTFGKLAGEPVEWLVLDTRDDGASLLLSRYVIFADRYHDSREPVTWEDSDLRRRLNSEDYHKLFSSDEKLRIEDTTVENHDNPRSGTPGGKDTQDKLFLLSFEETREYFSFDVWDEEKHRYSSSALATTPVESADMENLLLWEGEAPAAIDNSSSWWLRSPGSLSGQYACLVGPDGTILQAQIVDEMHGVRPAMWVRMK